MHPTDATTLNRPPPRRLRRALLWGALLALLGVAQTLLVALTVNYESTHAQDAVETVAAEAAAAVRSEILGVMQALQALAWTEAQPQAWREGAVEFATVAMRRAPFLSD